mmetsp:Transcript_2054/g.6004  ORF Transcript_2054/g.6004 Transcript_2054/m.6004 type:complete len:256 (-) Transcript_2054:320-1087(-)
MMIAKADGSVPAQPVEAQRRGHIVLIRRPQFHAAPLLVRRVRWRRSAATLEAAGVHCAGHLPIGGDCARLATRERPPLARLAPRRAVNTPLECRGCSRQVAQRTQMLALSPSAKVLPPLRPRPLPLDGPQPSDGSRGVPPGAHHRGLQEHGPPHSLEGPERHRRLREQHEGGIVGISQSCRKKASLHLHEAEAEARRSDRQRLAARIGRRRLCEEASSAEAAVARVGLAQRLAHGVDVRVERVLRPRRALEEARP